MNNIFFPKKNTFSNSFLVKNIDAAIHNLEVLFRNDATHLLPVEAEDPTPISVGMVEDPTKKRRRIEEDA